MNRQMWNNPATQANIQTIQSNGISIIGPGVGDQACGESGPGRMLEPDEIKSSINAHFRSSLLSGANVLITAGPTRESIDPVRFISNHSSGRMGFAVCASSTGS